MKEEKNITESFIKKNAPLLICMLIFIAGSLIRLFLRDMTSLDSDNFLVPWFNDIKAAGGFSGLDEQVGDYNILYQTIIAFFTYLPIKPLYAYKLFSCIFDLLLALLVAYIVSKLCEKNKKACAAAAFGIVYLSPLVILNSSWWAQCDAIYTFFGIASLYLLSRKKDLAAMIVYGAAVTFKLQAIFLLPVIVLVLFMRKKTHLLYLAAVPAVMIVLSLAGIIAGRNISDIFTIYFSQTSIYKSVALNYPSVWGLASDAVHAASFFAGKEIITQEQLYNILKYPAIAITAAALGAYMLVWLKKRVRIDLKNIIIMAFILSYTCVLLLPSMHERYGFIYEILALIIAFIDRKTVYLVCIMYAVTLITYIHFLSNCYFMPLAVLSAVNIFVYIMYAVRLSRFLQENSRSSSTDERTAAPVPHITE